MDPDVRPPLPEALLLQCRDPHRDLQDGVAHVCNLRGRGRLVLGRGSAKVGSRRVVVPAAPQSWLQQQWGRENKGKGIFVFVAALGGGVLVPQLDSWVRLSAHLSGQCWVFLALGTLGSRVGTAGLPLYGLTLGFPFPVPCCSLTTSERR